jgi:mRNA interferase MazF
VPNKNYTPSRGDIVFTDFDPAVGHEQQMKRPALVLSPQAYSAKFRLMLVVPITSRVRGHGFEVIIEGAKTKGAVLCHQAKTFDYNARGVKFIERAPKSIIDDVLAKFRLLVM